MPADRRACEESPECVYLATCPDCDRCEDCCVCDEEDVMPEATPRCCCHPEIETARQCIRRRYEGRVDDDEECECPCHYEQCLLDEDDEDVMPEIIDPPRWGAHVLRPGRILLETPDAEWTLDRATARALQDALAQAIVDCPRDGAERAAAAEAWRALEAASIELLPEPPAADASGAEVLAVLRDLSPLTLLDCYGIDVEHPDDAPLDQAIARWWREGRP